MPRISLSSFETAPLVPCAEAGEGVQMRALFEGHGHGLHAELLDMVPGAVMGWNAPPRGRLGFVWSGSAAFNGARLDAGSSFVVEHGGSATLRAIGPVRVVLFHEADHGAHAPARSGGRAHHLAAADVPRVDVASADAGFGGALFADASCPTCSLWLHENSYPRPDYEVPLHHHGEDEIIVVTQGEIVLGKRRYGPGTAIFVAADTLYGFHTGQEGLAYINFRPSAPTYVRHGQGDIVDERGYYLQYMDAPRYAGVEAGGG